MSEPDPGAVTPADAASAATLQLRAEVFHHTTARLGLLSVAQSQTLWQALQAAAAGPASAQLAPTSMRRASAQAPRFSFTHLLYYLGGLLAIGAATLFLTEAFQRLGAWALLAISLAYLAGCAVAARRLQQRGLGLPAGITGALAVCLVPLAVWALQHGLGLWPPGGSGGAGQYTQYHTHIDWRWLTLELATLAAAAVALWALREPFLMMPVAVTLWYMSMDLARLVVAPNGDQATWQFYRDFSMLFGAAMVLGAVWVDARSRGPGGSGRDFAFWLYLLGMLTFWGTLSFRQSDSELAKLGYGLLNLGFVFLGVLLQRRVFTVLGALGVAGYLGYLSHHLFKNSLLFPLALSLIGLAVVALGVWWQRHEARLQAVVRARTPALLRRWLPTAAPG